METEQMRNAWDYLLKATDLDQYALEVITAMNGYTLETLEGILYAATGYRNFGQVDVPGFGDDDEGDA